MFTLIKVSFFVFIGILISATKAGEFYKKLENKIIEGIVFVYEKIKEDLL